MRKHLLLITIIALAWSGHVHAQEFNIKLTEITPEQIIVHYDLVDTTKNRTYTVYVYSSRDNFLAPLTKVNGDIGLEVKPGLNHKIAWDSKAELGPTFNGSVELEVRGRVYVPFLRFTGFQDVKSVKRGVPFLIKWTGGTRQNILDFQLYKDNKLVYTFPNVPNASEYKLLIPTSVKSGKDYYLKVSDTKNKDQVVLTSKFQVKPKVPFLLKALPVVVIGATYPFWSKLFAKEKNNDLESPYDPPKTH
ncbi:MAG: hypothetical protein WDO14_06530 [Bacteroidota bacterium]